MAGLFQRQIKERAKCSAECEIGIKGNLGSDVNLRLGDTTKTVGRGGGLLWSEAKTEWEWKKQNNEDKK